MAKEELLRLVGGVNELLPNATFRVKVAEIPDPILAYIGGKMRMNHINICLGDTVDVEISQYDLTKGRIIYRSK